MRGGGHTATFPGTQTNHVSWECIGQHIVHVLANMFTSLLHNLSSGHATRQWHRQAKADLSHKS